jgi:hypothetical protein
MLWVHVKTSLAFVNRFARALLEAEMKPISQEIGFVARVFGVLPR